MLFGRRVLDDGDYAKMTAGRSGDEVALFDAWDPVEKLLIVLGMSLLFYGMYRFTLSRVCRNLGLRK